MYTFNTCSPAQFLPIKTVRGVHQHARLLHHLLLLRQEQAVLLARPFEQRTGDATLLAKQSIHQTPQVILVKMLWRVVRGSATEELRLEYIELRQVLPQHSLDSVDLPACTSSWAMP